MPIQEILELCASGNEERNMAISLAMHCAPVIKGSKIANIMTVDSGEAAEIIKQLTGTRISCFLLDSGQDRVILYLYRREELEKYLGRREIREFLSHYGYRTESLGKSLGRLSRRICLYSDGEIRFPHEIGAFLGYPIRDIRGFIENEGKNFIYLGYWKVYHNVQEAVRLFQRFDEERDQALREVVRGKTIQEIAV